MNRIIPSLLLSCCLLFAGCATISSWRDAAALKAGYQRKAAAENVVEQVKREYDAKLIANAADQEIKQAAVVKGLNDTRQLAADRLYGADFAFQTVLHPDRVHLVMDNKINEARAVLPPPTVEAMAKENAEVKQLLDETLTSLEQLQTTHAKALADAKVVSDREIKAEQDLAAAKQAKIDIEAAKASALAAKQADLDKANNRVIAAEHARGDDAKARQATLEKMSLWLGIFSLVGIATAIYLPVFRLQTGILGIVLGVAAVGIWYLTPLVVGTIALAVVVGLIGWMVYNHNVATKTNTALVNAVQDVKEKAKDVYDSTVKPALTEWTTKYTKDATGATVAVPDKAVTANIDAQLATSNRV